MDTNELWSQTANQLCHQVLDQVCSQVETQVTNAAWYEVFKLIFQTRDQISNQAFH